LAKFSILEVAAYMAMHFRCYEAKLPSLKLSTQPKLLLGDLSFDILLPITKVHALLMHDFNLRDHSILIERASSHCMALHVPGHLASSEGTKARGFKMNIN
jgi:hypothetical protein